MTMPISVVLLRHGQSESNYAKDRFEQGGAFEDEAGLMGVHTSERRLTPLGVEQAKAAGKWLRKNWWHEGYPGQYGLYVSTYIRAMETAANLGFGDDWRPDLRIVERNWGSFDQMPYHERAAKFEEELKLRKDHAFFWTPPGNGGESMQDVFMRLRDMTGTLHRECEDKRVLMVCHGETMWVWRTILERMLPQELRAAMLSGDDRIWIHNCRIIQYTRQDAHNKVHPRLVRFRFVDPTRPDDPQHNSGWMPIERRRWTHEDLAGYVETFRAFLPQDEAA